MNLNLEKIILKSLFNQEQYTRKILPYLKSDYFNERTEKVVFEELQKYILKYNARPSYEAIQISIGDLNNLTEDDYKSCCELIDEVSGIKDVKDEEWLYEQTEKFCQERALHNAILDSIHILDGKEKAKGKGAIPQLLTDALSVSFDPAVGHDYIDDADKRYEFYHKTEKRIPFDLEYFNKITKGGMPQKTLNVVLAGTGVGKSLFMCHVAASSLSQNYNVLYVTLEMAEERIAERIDANLLNIKIDELETLPKDSFERKIERLKQSVKGKLIIKEYPPVSAGSNHFRALMNELWLKKNFRPDILIVDYLNLCSSSRIKLGSNVNSYSFIKAIAEELRGLAVEFKIPILTATQTTRSGYSSTDPGLEDTSESFGLPATADFMFAMIATEEMEKLNQVMVKQLKNRYNDPTSNKRFIVGIDRPKMKLYDVEQSAQKISDSGQDDDSAPINRFGERERDSKNKFRSLKV